MRTVIGWRRIWIDAYRETYSETRVFFYLALEACHA